MGIELRLSACYSKVSATRPLGARVMKVFKKLFRPYLFTETENGELVHIFSPKSHQGIRFDPL